jgi:hypothetical protein
MCPHRHTSTHSPPRSTWRFRQLSVGQGLQRDPFSERTDSAGEL